MANERRIQFDSATSCISTTATVTDGEVVGGQTELDNSTNLYPMARVVLGIPDTFGATPAGPISLYMVRGDVDGTTNGTALGYAALTTSDGQLDPEHAEYMGGWNPDVDDVGGFVDTINIDISGVAYAKFYIHNETGTTLVYSATAITVKITPFTDQPTP